MVFVSVKMFFNAVSDPSESSAQLLAGKCDPKTPRRTSDTKLEEAWNVQEEPLEKVPETPKSSPERWMEIQEEMKSRPPEKVQEDWRKTNQVFQDPGLQQQQGTNICNGHLTDESWSPLSSVALFFCEGLCDVCFVGPPHGLNTPSYFLKHHSCAKGT